MWYTIVRVALSGPASAVSTNTVSKVCSDEMNATIDEKNTIGESRGRRILRNSRHAPAPSMRAASITDGEMFWSPARKMITLSPSDDQMEGVGAEVDGRPDLTLTAPPRQ